MLNKGYEIPTAKYEIATAKNEWKLQGQNIKLLDCHHIKRVIMLMSNNAREIQ